MYRVVVPRTAGVPKPLCQRTMFANCVYTAFMCAAELPGTNRFVIAVTSVFCTTTPRYVCRLRQKRLPCRASWI